MGWAFDDKLLANLLDKIPELTDMLNLNGRTEIHLGPKDGVIDGKTYSQKFVGTLGDLKK